MNINRDPIGQLSQWHSKAQTKAAPDHIKYDEQVDRFNTDFGAMSKMDGAQPCYAGLFSSAGDIDARPGNVNVPRMGSLQKTADGFSLQMERQGMYGSVAGWSRYQIDEKKRTIEVEHTTLPYAAGMFYSAGQTERFTLHTDTQAVSDYQNSPPAYIAGAPATKPPGGAIW